MKLSEILEYHITHKEEFEEMLAEANRRMENGHRKNRACECGGKWDRECLDCDYWFCSDCTGMKVKEDAKEFYSLDNKLPFLDERGDGWEYTCGSCLTDRIRA